MTELEYEKACRGTDNPIPMEFAWGTTGYANISYYTISGTGTLDEAIATNYSLTRGNANLSVTYNQKGPFRVGIFAGTAGNTGRVTSGATYYGIMEMSGNTFERTISVGKPEGRNFTGLHGAGKLDYDGVPAAWRWPSSVTAIGTGFRGGAFNTNSVEQLRVSDRSNANLVVSVRDWGASGGRGVRTH
jgi:hypothetical protein